ncbi:glycosyltransferase family 4 protein [Bdellovibrio bacteriovorus]|uniref:glycosyltransferase family 4 protein n=1 Tax=Bdellovibrio bacteriovorus TaxID=959 RepID=UPI0035A886F8
MKKVIYQFGSLAGWPYALAKGLRERGVDSINVISESADKGGTTNSTGRSNRQLKFDECLNFESHGKLRRLLNHIFLVLRILRNGKVVHYHGGTILPYNLDVLIFKIFGIPTVISWGGGDARIIEKAAAKNPYFFRYEEPAKDRRIRKMLKRLSKFGIVVATDPEMALYMEGYFDVVHAFKAPMDLTELTCIYPNPNNKKPVFLHVPTHPFVKGTIHIAKAFEKLSKEGLEFEPVLLESIMTQAEMRKKISECDVYVDELRCGSYGYTALEATGSGKPTLTYITDEVIGKLPQELPFVNTNADNIYENLKWLIQNPRQREEIGIKSRKYVEKYHSADVVVQDMISLYGQISRKYKG